MPALITKSSLLLVILLYSDGDADLETDFYAAGIEKCRQLDIKRSDSLYPEDVVKTTKMSNYFSCCALCSYQEGCHYFRWEASERTCSLLSNNTSHDMKKCSYPAHFGCLMSPCGYQEVYIPVQAGRAYLCLKARKDLGSPCYSVQDCGGGLHWECTGGRCRCRLGYLHSMSHRHCQRECDVPSSVFEAYNDTGVGGFNLMSLRNIQSVNDCLPECVNLSAVCRHVEHGWASAKCFLSDKAWFDVPEGNQLLYDPGYALYLRQCV
ncbi:uncharacterized protein LOC124259139 [Haliotis rubra]|uniref:uncharacterized protein LOC124259139 n=1 Tax=Haliotis rubra TaxID=36100 RepID=UPI001EE50539|nr:uncharacterized protein LOC124259139 [Haliotis rubra]